MLRAIGGGHRLFLRQASSPALFFTEQHESQITAFHQRTLSHMRSRCMIDPPCPSIPDGLFFRRAFTTTASEQEQSAPTASSRSQDILRQRKKATRSRRLLVGSAFLISCAIGMLRFIWLWEPEEKRSGQGAPPLPRDTFQVQFVRIGNDGDTDAAFGRSSYLCVEELGGGQHPVFVIADSWPLIQADKGRVEIEACANASNCRLVIIYRPGCGQSTLPEGGGKTLADWATAVEQLANRMYGCDQTFSVIGSGRVEGWYALACAAILPPSRLSSVHLLGEPQAMVGLGKDTAFNRLMTKLAYKFWRRRLFANPEEGIRQYIERTSGEEAALLTRHKNIIEILLKQGLYEGVDGALASMQLVYWTPHGFDAWSTAGAPVHYWSRLDHPEHNVPDHVFVHSTSHSSSLGILAEDLSQVLQAISAKPSAKQVELENIRPITF